jgi:hypothetical protein
MIRGFYECGSKIHKCMSFEDYKRHSGNDYRLEQAHKALIEIIDSMNMYYDSYQR